MHAELPPFALPLLLCVLHLLQVQKPTSTSSSSTPLRTPTGTSRPAPAVTKPSERARQQRPPLALRQEAWRRKTEYHLPLDAAAGDSAAASALLQAASISLSKVLRLIVGT